MGPLTLPGALSTCSDKLEFTMSLHTINYGIVLQLAPEKLNFEPHKLHNESITLDIPNLQEYIDKFQDLTTKEKEQGLDLKQVIKAIRDHKDVYF
jgi:hypothetical protein